MSIGEKVLLSLMEYLQQQRQVTQVAPLFAACSSAVTIEDTLALQ